MHSEFRESYLDLLKLVKTKSAKPDIRLVKKAYDFAKKAHSLQKRASGEPYFIHPLKVALLLADWGMDSETIAAGLLHDCLEDAEVKKADLKREFGNEVLSLVEGVTNLRQIASESRFEKDAKDLEKLLLASAKDLRIIVIKLADKIHNLKTLNFLPFERQKKIAQDAFNVYAPLAHKLSMHKARFEIEDLAFKALRPERFVELQKMIAQKKPALEKAIDSLCAELKRECAKSGIPVVFLKEEKAVYSTEEKIFKFKKSLNEIRDFVILNILTNNTDDCYLILGKLHSLFKPLPRKFKDFIALPEYNLYKALHTTVIGPNGIPVKCYISTFEMHEIADYGVIYFFRNKTAKNMSFLREKTNWVQNVLQPRSVKDHKEFIESLNSKLEQTVFLFTPKGRKIELPLESNPIDLAYNVHTDLGDHCFKSIVNGKETPITQKLNAGDVVEIIASKKLQARPSWLRIVKSHGALEALKRRFKK